MRPLWPAAALAALAATSVAVAQQHAAPITEPVWVTEPPRAQFRYPFAMSEYRQQVPLRCRVAGGALVECQAAEPTPENFLGAAIEAASQAQIAARDGQSASTDGREIAIAIQFPDMGFPVAVDPPPAPPNSSVLTGLVWLERADGSDFVRLYPVRARDNRVSGRATLDCLVGANGALSCTVLSEEPPGYGFGESALQIAREFRLAAQTREGAPTSGGRVRLPIRWVIE
jgi:TonB family protein